MKKLFKITVKIQGKNCEMIYRAKNRIEAMNIFKAANLCEYSNLDAKEVEND